mgnify:CR=1 FL=1
MGRDGAAVNVLLAVVEHAEREAEELEASARRKMSEAGLEMQRAATLRQVHALAAPWEGKQEK